MSLESSHSISPLRSTLDDVGELVAHLHRTRESERTDLARKLHDELGALLVSAVMDLGWADQHCSSADLLRDRLWRVRTSLRSAIDLKRAITETLRPTLLDNFGLFAACRWQFNSVCDDANISRTERYPYHELPMTDRGRTALFRIVQELLDVTLRESNIKAVALHMETTESALAISLQHEHIGRETIDPMQTFGPELTSVSHRVSSVQGQFFSTSLECSARYEVVAPLAAIMAL